MNTGGTISFGGLASGLDTESIVSQLVELKQLRIVRPLTDKIAGLKTRQLALSPVESTFGSLRTSALSLKDPTSAAYNKKSASSSDTDTVSINAITSNSAILGTYNISNISQLAQPDRVIFDGVANKDAATFGSGTIEITYEGTTHEIEIEGSNTLNNIASAINSADIGVTAAIINDGDASTPYRLTLTSDSTGADQDITHNIDSVLSLTEDTAATTASENEAQDALFEMNGISSSSSSNTVSDVIPGVTFALNEVDTTDTTTITIDQDIDSMISEVQKFVNNFNQVRQTLRSVLLPDTEGNVGILSSESLLTSAQVRVSDIISRRFNSLHSVPYRSLAEIGITTNANGDLEVDTSELQAVLEDDVDNVRLLFQGSTLEDGIAESMYDYVNDLTIAGGGFSSLNEVIDQNIADLEEEVEHRQELVSGYQLRLQTQFARLEQSLSLLQTQESAISSFQQVYTNRNNLLF